MFIAVVFLSVPFFKGTLCLMALPYAALGVRPRDHTVPAGAGLQGEQLRQDLTESTGSALQVNLTPC